jgi:hypothetical protein
MNRLVRPFMGIHAVSCEQHHRYLGLNRTRLYFLESKDLEQTRSLKDERRRKYGGNQVQSPTVADCVDEPYALPAIRGKAGHPARSFERQAFTHRHLSERDTPCCD